MTVLRDIPYQCDGRAMLGRLAVPDGAARRATPAVLIAHEANGLDDHQRDRAGQLAELGYVAFALDDHGDGSPPEFSDAQRRTAELWNDADRMRTIARAGLDVLLSEPATDRSRVAAIGYCFGGALVLELGRSGADLRAIVGFHPALHTPSPDDTGDITAVVLVCVGSEDPYVTIDDRRTFEQQLRGTGVDWRLHVYGGIEHSFTHPGAADAGLTGLRYREPTAERAWQSMLDLFDEVL